MSDLEQYESEQRRLAILKILLEDGDYTLNEDIISHCLETLGLGASAAHLHGDLLHLKTHGAIYVEIKGKDLYVATLSPFGADVAKGRERAPGVAKPKPGRG